MAETSAIIREAVRRVAPEVPVGNAAPIYSKIARWKSRRRLVWLLSLHGLIATSLAMVGVSSVATQVIAQRRRELAIRVSLGATRRDLTLLVLGREALPVVCGLVGGLLAAWCVTQVLRNTDIVASQLYQVGHHDPLAFLSAAGCLGLGRFWLNGFQQR